MTFVRSAVLDGLTTTHTKRVTGQPGEHVVVEFK